MFNKLYFKLIELYCTLRYLVTVTSKSFKDIDEVDDTYFCSYTLHDRLHKVYITLKYFEGIELEITQEVPFCMETVVKLNATLFSNHVEEFKLEDVQVVQEHLEAIKEQLVNVHKVVKQQIIIEQTDEHRIKQIEKKLKNL